MNSLGAALAADLDAGFPKLVAACRHRVYALALSLTGNAHDAEEVAQDAFVRAYRALKKYPRERLRALQVRPWLAKIALNVWRNRIRGRKNDGPPPSDELEGDPRERPDNTVARAESAGELRAFLSRLPERYRVAVVLRHAYDVPYAEAAAALGIPIGTLKANVHRGTRMLREAFEANAKAARP